MYFNGFAEERVDCESESSVKSEENEASLVSLPCVTCSHSELCTVALDSSMEDINVITIYKIENNIWTFILYSQPILLYLIFLCTHFFMD